MSRGRRVQSTGTGDPLTHLLLYIVNESGVLMAKERWGDKWLDILDSAHEQHIEVTIMLPLERVKGRVEQIHEDDRIVTMECGNEKWNVGLDFILAIGGHAAHP